ncbi:hypothetical protein Leryth_012519 [Lithospermum erythrorhizon]|nr:hypothetical protein Leryth_012519 [Lithospermum erythrorhizon]
MADSSTKFASINLRKSYGQQQSLSHNNHHSFNANYGQAARGRPGNSVGTGGGMVVLSRSKTSQKASGAKLSVPPPLNLPSLRKEHEKFDVSGSGGGTGSGAGPSRPTSSGVGWSKPPPVALQDKNASVHGSLVEQLVDIDIDRNHGSYLSSSARPAAPVGHVSGSARAFLSPVEKASVLRGEDFPSLHAALPVSSGTGQKQKDGTVQKQKQTVGRDSSYITRDGSRTSALVDMHSQVQSLSQTVQNGLTDSSTETHGVVKSPAYDQSRKPAEYFPGPLPLVVNPRSDWADDERDTGHGLPDRSRDIGFPKGDDYWDRDFDLPRASVLPSKPVYKQFERQGLRDNESGKVFSSAVLKVDNESRNPRTPSREGRESNNWRSTSFLKGQNVDSDRNGTVRARGSSFNKDTWKDTRHTPPHAGDADEYSGIGGNKDSTSGRKDRYSISEPFDGRASGHNTRDRYGIEQSSRYRGDTSLNTSKSSFASGGKMAYIPDPILEKSAFIKSERIVDDSFHNDFGSSTFDDMDPFYGGWPGVIKRKKDMKPTDFVDPVRESFEAELERVQRMQELERQRLIDEQERTIKEARKEEEEKQRLIREEEERQRRLEEEAREAAWREEQERLEAIQKAEEQRMAREEEKNRIFMEEERRKQAAKQKLLELEAKMAKRQTGSSKAESSIDSATFDERLPSLEMEKDNSSTAGFDNWEENERMVERITNVASIESSSSSNRDYEINMKPYSGREDSSSIPERGKSINPWKRDVFGYASGSSSSLRDHEMGHFSPRGDPFVGGRVVPRKDLYGAARSRGYLRRDMQDHYMDEFGHQRDQRWNFPGDADIYKKPQLDYAGDADNFAEKYGDGWAQGRYRGNHLHLYPNDESDELYSYGRSRYAMRQPRVLPPPSLATAHRTPFDEHPSPSNFLDNSHYHHTERSESSRRMGYYGNYEDGFETADPLAVRQENPTSENLRRNEETTPRSDSQSSLSVTSPPNSSPHLSHDELDESGSSPVISPTVHEGKVLVSGNGSSDITIAKIDSRVNVPSCASPEVDNWTVDNHDTLLQQEEYDEHEDGYQEEYEVHEGEDENLDINQEFEDLHLEERESSDTVDNLVLGFDDGVQVQLSSVDFQKDPRLEERGFGVSDASEQTLEDLGSLKSVQGDLQILHPMDGSQITIDSPSKTTVHESVKATTEPNEPTAVAPDLPTDIDVSGNYGLSPRQTVSPATEAICSSTQLAPTSTSSQADLPVRLQFGLFSGPSLFPSPVPAIQIGSIQMPLHPPVGPSLTSHIYPPQCPVFQFGQLTYTSPISHGILPMPSMSVASLQPNVQANNAQPAQDTSCQAAMQKEVKSHSKFASGSLHQSRDSFLVNNLLEDDVPVKTQDAEIPQVAGDQTSLGLTSKGEHEGQIGGPIQPPNQFASGSKKFSGVRNLGIPANNRGRRYAYAIKNSNTSTNFPANSSLQDSGGFHRRPRRFVQRTEFRVRENGDKRHYSGNVSTNNSRLDEKWDNNGRHNGVFERSVFRQGNKHRKPLKEDGLDHLVSAPSNFQGTNPGNKKDIENGNHASTRDVIPSHSMDDTLKRNMSEEDFGAPLQSGVVQVFNQPGIEAPSDEDDFIQVRSKRQMLNDRREQRQKEIKAKYPVSKPPKKARASKQSISVSTSVEKPSVGVYAATPKLLDVVASEGHGMLNTEVTADMLLVTSQPLPPIGAPAKNCEPHTVTNSQTNKSTHTSAASNASPGGSNLVSSSISQIKNKLVDDVPSSMTSWGATQTTEQVMSLTQTQLEEAMKPVCFDTHIPSSGGGSSSTIAEATPSTSILTKDKSFSLSVSPINSLLAGEKIQFGAVTSTTILPLGSHPASHGIRVHGSIPTDMQILQKSTANESGIFFDSDKNTNSCIVHDCEAEAEAAASAVAVAAIGGDETVGSRIGSVCNSDAKDFGCDVDENSAVMAGNQKLSNQSRGEDSLTVSLPADLSVETPAISMWPNLPSPQSSSGQLLSHFPGGPPSHFPFYEMNPMLGRPVFSLQHETSTDNQSQSQTHTPSISGPFSSWQHSAADSFYGPPAGYPGPFISPPGGISGVQGPHHMVVYNHFAPAGQFGQVGLSFMGATYIPTGKQPDWKHNPTSSAMGIGEEDINSINMASSQHRNSNLASTNQHLSPGSPLMPVASPLAMFDVSPFQPPEVSAQAHWPNVPAPLNSIPASRALHQQVDGILPSQFGHGRPADQSVNANKFLDTETSVARSHPSFSMSEGASVTQFSDQLGLVDSSLPNSTGTSSQSSSRYTTAVDADRSDGIRNVAGNNKGNATFRSQSSLQHRNASAQQGHSAGYGYQRGGSMSQRNTSGSEWTHRRMGNNSRHQSQGAEKGFPASKVKQIYVAKQTMNSGAPSAG